MRPHFQLSPAGSETIPLNIDDNYTDQIKNFYGLKLTDILTEKKMRRHNTDKNKGPGSEGG